VTSSRRVSSSYLRAFCLRVLPLLLRAYTINQFPKDICIFHGCATLFSLD
jgi:hypothetical protein